MTASELVALASRATRAAAGPAAARRPLLRHGLLFLAHALIEHREGFVEAAVDLRAAVLDGLRPGT